jgi:DNA mismatch endonuclease, patch repair protein
MVDVFTEGKRSEVMSRIRGKDTRAEVGLRKALHSRGFRYRLHVMKMPGRPDIVLPKYRTVIQVRGCFWHGHGCIDGHVPKSRRGYWVPKLRANKERDAHNDRALRSMGWKVVVVWECSLSSRKKIQSQVDRVVRRILSDETWRQPRV